MCAGFVYRPHVETAEGVFTPDIVLDRLVVAAGGGEERFRVSVDRLTCDDAIEVLGGETVGQGAVALIASGAGALIGIGSDHIDRTLADTDPARARQLCAKPLARGAWRFAEVVGHLDALVLTTAADADGGRSERTGVAVSSIAGLPDDGAVPPATALLAHPGAAASVPPGASSVTIVLEDRRLSRRLTHRYAVRVL